MKNSFYIGFGLALVMVACGTSNKTVSAGTNNTNKTIASASAESMESKAEVASAAVSNSKLDEGRAMYSKNCAKCHDLFKPTDFNKEQWAPILVSMQKKAHLSDEEMAPITAYIYAQL